MTATLDQRREPPEIPEMGHLIRSVVDLLDQSAAATTVLSEERLARLADRFGFASKGTGRAEVVIGGQVAVELGHPSTASSATVLTTTERDLIFHGRVRRLGPDLPDLASGGPAPLGQIVMVELASDEPPDPFALELTQHLINRLPGYMVRAMPSRLWVRVSRRGLERGLDLDVVGAALIRAYREEFPQIRGVEVTFVTSSAEEVESLAPIVLEAEARAGRHKRLTLDAEGRLDCLELNCETCEDRPVCDAVREVMAQRREAR